MNVGVSAFMTDRGLNPNQLAPAIESRGFESLWVPEHSHFPIPTESWHRINGSTPLPEHYVRTLDSFTALAAAAAVTDHLRLATGVCLVAQRDHIWLAKQTASLDQISNGRLILGIGYGWNREEMANHGISYDERRSLVRERVLAMKELWTKEVASYYGAHVRLRDASAWPKPVQQPHPPILMGARLGPKTLTDIVEYCDGWLRPPAELLDPDLATLRSSLSDAGRDPDSLDVTIHNASMDREFVRGLRAKGVNRVVFRLPSSGRTVLDALDHVARFCESLGLL